MPWPRRRALCVVCLASCESVVSSFGVGIGSSSIPCSAAPGGGHVRGGATSNLSMTGLQDGGPSRKGLPAVRAVAEVDQAPQISAPSSVSEKERASIEEALEAGLLPDPPSGPPMPEMPALPSIQDGVKMELGKYKAEPFEAGSFPPNYLYALQRLRSEEDESFGAAFISLRAAKDRASTRTWNVGRPNATNLMALARFKIWWMMPKHSTKAGDMPPETQMMLTKLSPDPETGKQLYALFIPLIDGQAKCSLKGLPDGSLQLFAETGCPKTPVPSSDVAGLYVGVHEDPFKLVEKSFKLVNARLRNQVKAGSFGAGGLVPGLVHDAEKQLSRWKKSEVISKAVDKTSPDFSNYLGWCTWDSFYTSVDHDKVFEGLQSLRDEGIYPKWLVLDDGWQSTSNVDAANGEQWMDHLTSLVANDKFRDTKAGTDLSRTVDKARKEFGIDYFLVWHAIAGYWAGVDLDSPELMKYKPRRSTLIAPPGVVEVDPDMKMFFRVAKFLNKRFGVVPPEKIRAFYDDYHRYLRSQGVDGVKVDAQSVVNFLGAGNGGSVMLSRAFHSALSKSVRRHFPDSAGEKGEGGRIIHCMCHDSEILLQLPACYDRKPVIRGSDDFYPRDTMSHSPHIYANAYNALMISNCGLQDWDMFQTGIGDASWMHAAARAVSGGPVYISDRPGEHNVEILRRMVLEDGSVLKPPVNALPCLKSLFLDPQRDPDALLSIWNECEAPGHGVVAVFNLFGSAWSQGRRTYVPIRIPSGALSGVEVNGGNNVNGNANSSDALAAADGIVDEVKPSDCYRLLRDSMADRDRNGDAEPRYALHFHFADRLVVGGLHEAHELRVKKGKSEVVAMSEILAFDTPVGAAEFASIGLADMFNSGGAIVTESLLPRASAPPSVGVMGGAGEVAAIEVMVKGSGRFLAHCSLRPNVVLFDGKPVEFSHENNRETGPPCLELVLPQGYTGVPRQLIVQWGDEPAKAGVGAGLTEARVAGGRRHTRHADGLV